METKSKKPPRKLVTTRVAHSSGRFDRSESQLAASVERLRRGRTIVTGTEAKSRSDKPFNCDPEWGYVHLPGKDGEYWATWLLEFWEYRGHARTVLLSMLTFFRFGGKKSGKPYMLIVPLFARHSGRRVFVIVVHMPTDKTKWKAFIWKRCAKTVRRRVKRLRRIFPQAKFIVIGDLNKNYRQHDERTIVKEKICDPANLVQGWRNHVPINGGTHGPHGLIDDSLTDLQIVDQRLLEDDQSSDHRPFETLVVV